MVAYSAWKPSRWVQALSGPVDIAWLAAFRILFGLTLFVSTMRFIAYGWVERLFVTPQFYFKYWGFEWVEPLPAAGMQALFWALAALSLMVAAGAAFRLSALLFAAGLTYFQLIDVSTYLNHYYLAALLTWLLAISPAHRIWSVDAWLRRRWRRRAVAKAEDTPAQRISALWLYLFRFQVGLVYTCAGLAKAQSDWLLHAQPLRMWLGANVDLPVIGPLFTLPWVPLAMSWAGFLFDTTIVGWLLWSKSRPWAYAVVILFHAMTRALFPIGMFPVIMVLSALVFFAPGWPRRWLGRLRGVSSGVSPEASVASAQDPRAPVAVVWRPLALAIAVGYCLVQLVLPMRFLVYGDNVLWHEQGMRFSWRVMLRAKGGDTTFIVRNKETGREWHISPRSYLTGMQESEMAGQPDLILQLAHHIQKDMIRRGFGPVEVRADSRVSLNGRRSAQLIDPEVNLVTINDGLGRAQWILPAPPETPPHTVPVL